MRKAGKFIFLVLLIFIRGFAFAQDITVQGRLDTSTIKLGGQTTLRFSAHVPIAQKVSFPQLADSIAGKIEIVESEKIDTVFDKEDVANATLTKTYTVTSFEAGSYSIPPYEIKVGNSVYKTLPLPLNVEAVAVDTTKGIYDIKKPLQVKYTFLDWLRDNRLYVALVLVGIALLAALIFYMRKQPKAKPAIKEVKPVIPAHITALEKLRELQQKKLWQQDSVKQHHSELTDIVREYLEKRFAIQALEQTTEEIFASLKKADVSKENKELLRHMLVLADLVKFAKEKPLPHENEQSVEDAVRFVETTKPRVEPVENKGT